MLRNGRAVRRLLARPCAKVGVSGASRGVGAAGSDEHQAVRDAYRSRRQCRAIRHAADRTNALRRQAQYARHQPAGCVRADAGTTGSGGKVRGELARRRLVEDERWHHFEPARDLGAQASSKACDADGREAGLHQRHLWQTT